MNVCAVAGKWPGRLTGDEQQFFSVGRTDGNATDTRAACDLDAG